MDDRIEELPESSCLQLLRAGGVGRVALNADPAPIVLPVSYVARERHVLFATAGGTKWDAATAGSAASFEVDGTDGEHRSGWSVLVRGTLSAIDDDAAAPLLDQLAPLPDGDRPHVVRLEVEEVSGRRIPPDAGWSRAHREHHTWTGRDGSDLLG